MEITNTYLEKFIKDNDLILDGNQTSLKFEGKNGIIINGNNIKLMNINITINSGTNLNNIINNGSKNKLENMTITNYSQGSDK